MPESFERRLASMADAAVSDTRTPSAADVRRRGHQRTVHRRMVASAAAFVTVCGLVAGGVVTKVLGGGPNNSVVPAATFSAPPLPTAGPTRAHRTATSPAPAADSSAPNPSGSVSQPPGFVTGIWKRSDGAVGYLIIYPTFDAGLVQQTQTTEIAISEAGAFPLCYGQIATAVDGSGYEITDVACGGNLAPSMTLTYNDTSGTTLVLHIPAGSGGQETDIPYTMEVQSTTGSPQTGSVPASGTWADAAGTVTVNADGKVGWSVMSHGVDQIGSGTVTGYFDGGAVVTGPCSSGIGECNVLQLQFSPDLTQLTVIGSYGPEVFTRKL
jgi:hypothetical protein